MSQKALNLGEVGVQTKAGVAQGQHAEAHNSNNQALGRKLEPMDQEFVGRGGSAFGQAAVGNLESGTELGKRLAELALGAVLGEKVAVQADDEAGQEQQQAVSHSHDTRGLISKPINA